MTSYDGNLLEQRDTPRSAIVRRSAIYVPAAIVLTVLLLLALLGLPGSILAVLLLGLAVFAVNVEAYQGVADLLSDGPVTSRGRVTRRWSKSRFLFFGRVHYLLVEARPVHDGAVDEDRKASHRLFEVLASTALELERGDELEVVHWPHTNAIVTLRRTRTAMQQDTLRRDEPSADPQPE